MLKQEQKKSGLPFFHPSDLGSKLSGSSVTTNKMLQNFLLVTLQSCVESGLIFHNIRIFFSFQGVTKGFVPI